MTGDSMAALFASRCASSLLYLGLRMRIHLMLDSITDMGDRVRSAARGLGVNEAGGVPVGEGFACVGRSSLPPSAVTRCLS